MIDINLFPPGRVSEKKNYVTSLRAPTDDNHAVCTFKLWPPHCLSWGLSPGAGTWITLDNTTFDGFYTCFSRVETSWTCLKLSRATPGRSRCSSQLNGTNCAWLGTASPGKPVSWKRWCTVILRFVSVPPKWPSHVLRPQGTVVERDTLSRRLWFICSSKSHAYSTSASRTSQRETVGWSSCFGTAQVRRDYLAIPLLQMRFIKVTRLLT